MEQRTILYLFGAVLAVGFLHFFLLSPPGRFPEGETVSVEPGWSLAKVSLLLKEKKVIRSRVAFEFFVITLGGEKRIRPAYYTFPQELPVFTIAWRISGGKFALAPVAVTIPEGFSNTEIVDVFSKKLPNFEKEEFLALAADLVGYLFPDTYFFLNTDDAEAAIKSMTENYEKKIEPFRAEILNSGHTEKEIITMASIVEGEAKGDDDRAIIAGILWKRLKIDMALQADAAPVTYKEKGLPTKPIGNPGLEAIKAAIHPEASPYLYYLHDQDGNIHYAKNFAEHRANIKKYLK